MLTTAICGEVEARRCLRPVKAATTLLRRLGYAPDQIVERYPVWLGGSDLGEADVAAFGRAAPLDMTTATVVVRLAASTATASRSARVAQALAAPILLTLGDSEVELSAIQSSGAPRVIERVAYPDLEATRWRDRLGPEELLLAKLGQRQLSLFPLDVNLLSSAREVSGDRFSPLVERALRAAVEVSRDTLFELEGSPDSERLHQKAARLVVGALTALVLRDKEGLSDLRPGALADVSQQRYANYFSWMQLATPSELTSFESLIEILGEGVNYRSLDPRLLSNIYERALVSDAQRRGLATHYTPPGLAARMLATVPVEYLPPDSRRVLDPTCGSGGLLIAAYDRLGALRMPPRDGDLVTNDIAVSGYDSDAFAVELARLGLLLNSMPANDDWNIRQTNVLTSTVPRSEAPNIIVANPPWNNSNQRGKRREETADRFVRWMIRHLEPGGFLSVVLPTGWLNSRSSHEDRDYLRQACDLFEVWRLPEDVFETARMAPAVLFAQKRLRPAQSQKAWVFKRVVRSAAAESFYRTGEAESTFLSPPNEVVGSPILAGELTALFRSRPDWPTVEDSASVVTGPQPVSGLRDNRSGNARYLRNARSVAAFNEVSSGDIVGVHFPDDFQHGSSRGAEGIGTRKVVVSAARSTQNPWRLKTMIDTEGIIVRNSLQMVIPLDSPDDTILWGLFALMSSAFASLWIDETVSDRNISTADIRHIPAPTSEAAWARLASIGRSLGPSTAPQVLRELDAVVFSEMEIPARLVDDLLARLAGFNGPEGAVRYDRGDVPAESMTGRQRRRFGSTISIDGSIVVISAPGVTPESGEPTRMPLRMSGWMARAGATYGITIARGQGLRDAEYNYQPASWVPDTDLAVGRRPTDGDFDQANS